MNGYYLKWGVTIILIFVIALAPFAVTIEEALPLVGFLFAATIVRLLLSWLYDVWPRYAEAKQNCEQYKEKVWIDSCNPDYVEQLEAERRNLFIKLRNITFLIIMLLAFAIGFALLVSWSSIFENCLDWLVGVFKSIPLFH